MTAIATSAPPLTPEDLLGLENPRHVLPFSKSGTARLGPKTS